MDNKSLLNRFIPMVDFIADVIGPHCEVILHRVDSIEDSAVAIRNGYISGRQIGCPLTDLAVELIEKKVYQERSAVINYLSRTSSGEKLRSSTFFIKDEQGKLVGMLCVNVVNSADNLLVKNLTEKLVNVLMSNKSTANVLVSEPVNEKIEESLSPSIETVVDSAIEKVIREYDMPVERMSIDEKISIVQKLNSNGIFKIKGSVTKAASILQTSESTIYRYLSSK
ncbi:MAG: PAS domain-containing protein [Selenomonadaceae bacterium]